MTRFNIEGQYLDLYADTDLQFARTNILFAFDKIECARSASFEIPATPHNNNILLVANNEAYFGEQGRTRLSAQMQYSGGAVDGYLYITSADREQYTCVFVFGELLGLQAIRDAGLIGDFMQFADSETLGRFEEDCSLPLPFYAAVPYQNGHAYAPNLSDRTSYEAGYFPLPSFNLAEMLQQCAAPLGITIDTTDAPILDDTRITIAKPRITTAAQSVAFDVTQNVFTGTIDTPYIVATQRFIVYKRSSLQATWNAVAYRATEDVKITFANDFPSTLFLIQASGEPRSIVFLGGYECDRNGTITGTPLAGREITIEKGGFMFATAEMIERARNDYGLMPPSGDYTYSGNADVQAVNAIGDIGGTIYLQENLPEVTLVDLLKIAAAVSGTFIYYENNVVTFVADIDTSDILSLNKIISLKDVQRTFGGYAQENKITFAENEEEENTWEAATYYIYNVNISKENTLQEIPFSRGLRVSSFTGEETNLWDVEIHDVTLKDAYTHEYPNDYGTLIYCGDNPYAEPLPMVLNERLTDLCLNATSVRVQAVLTLKEFNNMRERQLLQVRGQLYVWTAATWQNGIASLELSKVAI